MEAEGHRELPIREDLETSNWGSSWHGPLQAKRHEEDLGKNEAECGPAEISYASLIGWLR